jgi:hypothetical protein
VPRPGQNYKKTWFKDESVIYDGSGGGPPPNHPRRCQSRNAFGTQCGRWALVGRDYCQKHGGRNHNARKVLANYYSKHAGKKLSDLLAELALQNDDERLSLAEEIDVARLNASRVLNLFEKIVIEESFTGADGKQLDLTAETKMKLKSSCANAVKESLDQVSSLVQAMAKVEALKADKISVNNIKWVVNRIMRLIEEIVVPYNADAAKELCAKISDMRLLENGQGPQVVLSIS